MVKFGKQIKRLADDSQLNHCIAYDVLKKAISVVAAAEGGAPAEEAVQAVKDAFGQPGGIAGSGRPPDSRFHCLLQHELAKVNRFFALQLRTHIDALRDAQAIAGKPGPLSEETLLDLENRLDAAAEQLISIEHFRRLNFTGFRKIVKKFDKRPGGSNAGSLSSWFLPQLWREPFVAEPLDAHLLALSWGYAALRRHRNCPERTVSEGNATAAASTASVSGTGDFRRGRSTTTSTKTFWLMPPARIRALCTLVKRFELVTPSMASPQEARPMTAVDYAAQMRQLLNSIGAEGPAKATCVIKAENALTFYDDAAFSQYLARVRGEGPCGLRRRQTVPSAQGTADNIGIVESDGTPDALSVNAFTTVQTSSMQAQGSPIAVVDSARILLRGDTHATAGVSIALDEDVQFSMPSETGATAPGEAVDFPYSLLEVACAKDDSSSWGWLEELQNYAALRTVHGFSVGAHAVAGLYKDRVPEVPQWYQHLETMENSAPPEAWGLKREWRTAVNEEPQQADAVAEPHVLEQHDQPAPPSDAASYVPIEPKNYLACERTMLEWLHTVLALATLGIGLWKYSLSISDPPERLFTPVAFGLLNAATWSSISLGCYSLALVMIALCFAWYAVMSHIRRLDALIAGKHTERIFNWRPGPLVFAGLVGMALLTNLGVQIVPLWLALGTGSP